MLKRKVIIGIIAGAIGSNLSMIPSNVTDAEATYSAKASLIKMEVISSSDLNVRKGPSTKYSKIGSLKKGTIVEVISTSNGWAKIKYKNTTGYCSAKYLKAVTTNGESINNNPSNSNSSNKKEMIVKCDTLNVRSGASTKNALLGKLNKGDKVVVLEELSNGWVKIEYKGKYGYVSNVNNKYLEKVSSDNSDVSTKPTTPPTDSISTDNRREMIAKVDDLNVRAGAGTKYSIIGKINKGDTVIVLEELSSGWVKIEFENKIGYVSNVKGAYLEHGFYVKDKESANNTIKLIDALNSKIDLTYKDKILKARESYNLLNNEAKSLVSNLSTLLAAEEKLSSLNEVEYLINAINLLSDNILLSDKETVSSLINRFDALSNEFKSIIYNSDKLIEAELEIARLERIPANITACDVMDLIYALPTVSNIHYSSEGDVKYARSAFKMLSDTEKLYVLNIDKLNEVEQEWKRIDNGIKFVSNEISKIPAIDSLTLNDKYLVENARNAYDNSDSKITYHINYMNYDHLVSAEEKINELIK